MSTQHQDAATDSTTSGGSDASAAKTSDQRSDADDASEALPLDVVFEIIRNERRRLVLEFLEDVDEQTTLSDLAEHIAAIENDTTVEALSAQQRKRVYVGLYQCHLPKMADSGVVEFDKDRGTVRPGENADQLEPYLAVSSESADDRVDRWYPVLAGVAVVGYLLAAFGGAAGQVAGGVVVAGAAIAVVATAAARRGGAVVSPD